MSANYRPIKFNLRSGDIKLTMNTLDLGSGGGGGSSSPVVARGSFAIDFDAITIAPIGTTHNIASELFFLPDYPNPWYGAFKFTLDSPISDGAQVFSSFGSVLPSLGSSGTMSNDVKVDNTSVPGTSIVEVNCSLLNSSNGPNFLHILVLDTTAAAAESIIYHGDTAARGSFVVNSTVPSITPITPNVNIANTSIVSMGFHLEFVVELSQPVSNAAQVFVSCGAMPPSGILRDTGAVLDNSTTPGTSYVRGRLYPDLTADINLYILVKDTTVGAISATTNGAVVARGTYDTAETTGASTPRLPMMNVVGCTDEGVIPQASPPYPAWVLNPNYNAWSYRVELAIRLSDSATIVHTLFQPLELLALSSWVFIDNTTSPTVSYLNIQISESVPVPFGPAHFGFSFIVTDVGSV